MSTAAAGGGDDKKRKQDHVIDRDDDPKPKTRKAYLLEIAKKHSNVQKALEEIAEVERDVAAARDKLAALLHKFDTEELDTDEEEGIDEDNQATEEDADEDNGGKK
ncbi:uncharacterized protein LOC121779512 [Salvia splendens]|uniref:uncharacterized protein LOC121779512 n=1 Tax=Salvia splendens TaxID=180675 RepID=UPI001C267034|nr:uncharacterized protein LOC121779512 [Salvia splendens]